MPSVPMFDAAEGPWPRSAGAIVAFTLSVIPPAMSDDAQTPPARAEGNRGDFVSQVGTPRNQIAPDESGASGYEDFHDFSPLRFPQAGATRLIPCRGSPAPPAHRC